MKNLLTIALLGLSGFALADQGTCLDVNHVFADNQGAIFDLRKTINNENSNGQQYKANLPGTDLRLTCDLTTTGTTQGTIEVSNCTVKSPSNPQQPFPITLSYTYTVQNNNLTLTPLYTSFDIVLVCVK